MIDDITLFSAIAAGDLQAAETLTQRLAAPLFRYCRLNFTDHFRAGEFVETTLASWIDRIRNGDIGLQSILDLFEEASRLSSDQWRDRRGKGLSSKQFRILEIMEEMPLVDRVALDLVLLEQHDRARVAGWLGLSVEVIDRGIEQFLDKLSKDEKIGELLKYAAIQQSRKKRVGSSPSGKPRSFDRRQTGRGAEGADAERRRSRPSRVSRSGYGKESVRSERDGSGDRARESGKDVPEHRRLGPDQKHQELRPRRRRVDPREIDVDI